MGMCVLLLLLPQTTVMTVLNLIKTEFAKCVLVWGFSKSRIHHEYLLFWFPKFIILCLNS